MYAATGSSKAQSGEIALLSSKVFPFIMKTTDFDLNGRQKFCQRGNEWLNKLNKPHFLSRTL